MSKKDSPFVFGESWLARRRDGRSPEIWQIVTYDKATRSLSYKSTKQRDLDKAKEALRIHELAQRSERPADPQHPLAVPVVPELLRYWEEHGRRAVSAGSIAAGLRAFLAFLQTQRIGTKCTFADVHRDLIERFRIWRMAPHEYEVEWYGKRTRHRSRGVGGASFKRNLAIVKAALNHAVANEVVPHLRRIPPMPAQFNSPPSTRVLSIEEIGAMIAYADQDKPLLHWLILMLATGARPEAAMKMVPANQYMPQIMRLNLHPLGARRTKKRNPIVPIIPELAALLGGYKGSWIAADVSPYSLRRRWRQMVWKLGFGPEVVTRTIRHTVASRLEWAGAREHHISQLLGHSPADRSPVPRLHFRSDYMSSVVGEPSAIWREAYAAAEDWRTRYAVASNRKGAKVVVYAQRFAAVQRDPSCLRRMDEVAPRKLAEERSLSDPSQLADRSWEIELSVRAQGRHASVGKRS